VTSRRTLQAGLQAEQQGQAEGETAVSLDDTRYGSSAPIIPTAAAKEKTGFAQLIWPLQDTQ